MRNMFFGKWGFPFELAANLYQSLGRWEEARDTARLALKQPWWTISDLAGCVLPSRCFSKAAVRDSRTGGERGKPPPHG